MNEEPLFHTTVGEEPRRRPWWLWVAIVAVALSIALGLILYSLVDTGQRSESNAQIASQIQDERARATLLNCRAQNKRHSRLVKALDPLIEQRDPSRAERKAARQFTTALADAIAPIRDCKKVVERSVGR